MAESSNIQHRRQTDNLVARLASQLRRQALWDSLLLFVPPALAAIYIAISIYRFEWIGPVPLFLIVVAVTGLGLLAVGARMRPRLPSIAVTASLVDERARSQDRFLTLATIDRSPDSALFVSRLSRETADYAANVELKRDFPYRVKKSFHRSLLASAVMALLIQLLMPVAQSVIRPVTVQHRLGEIAEKMAHKEGLKQLAQELKVLAAKLEDRKLPQEDKQAAVQEMEKKIEEQQKKEGKKDNQDLLGEAASTVKGLEEQQSSGGQEQKKDQEKGGGIQSNLPQDGKGKGKQSQGGGSDNKGEMSAQMSNDMQQGKSAQGNPKEQNKDKNQQSQADTKGDQRDANQPGKEQNNEKIGKNQGGPKEGAGKNQGSEEPPQGAPPADRFYKAGEGKEGIKNARYVTVQLPEDMAADSKGESKTTKEGTGNRARPHVPVSNAPLPAHVPNAPTEKQQMPIEYRGIIR